MSQPLNDANGELSPTDLTMNSDVISNPDGTNRGKRQKCEHVRGEGDKLVSSSLSASHDDLKKCQNGQEFWRIALHGASKVVAPMVEQSELPWRILSRRYGADLCYTPMMHANVYARDATYRKDNFQTCEEDRPLIVQFCANDPDQLLTAALKAQPFCDAIDINLGCPQTIAKKGHYGAFLQDEWDLVKVLIQTLHLNLDIPVTCKIRIFQNDPDKTIRYAKMIEEAGCALLTVHGRYREQKGMLTGLADWDIIRRVKESLSIPVFANGNIQYFEDVDKCLKVTGAEGVMTAEGNLHNPGVFRNEQFKNYRMAEEYLEIVSKHPCASSCIRGHLFKLFHHSLVIHQDLRTTLANCKSLADFRDFVGETKARVSLDESKARGRTLDDINGSPAVPLRFPHWICQPYERPKAKSVENIPDIDRGDIVHLHRKRQLESAERELEKEGKKFSKNQLKKLMRNPKKTFEGRKITYPKCSKCGNPAGLSCCFELCKTCCRKLPGEERKQCVAHFKDKKTETQTVNSIEMTDSILTETS